MQAIQLIEGNYSSSSEFNVAELTGKVGSWLNRVFGCHHRELSRPFSSHGQTYRACVNCGARRQFNLRSWEMQGRFYYSRPAHRQLSVVSPGATKISSAFLAISRPTSSCA